MPEGDTLHRSATRLRPALAGAQLVGFTAPRLIGDRPTLGQTIERVEAVGKHLVISFDGGLALRTHLRMSGSWHLYRTGQRWRKGRHLARVVIEVPGWVAVCFSAPVVETWYPDRPGGALGIGVDPLAALGPDLAAGEVSEDQVVTCLDRMAALAGPDDEIGPVLLDQRVAAGIGNVYKSEVCFACGIDPATPATGLDDPSRARLIRTANRLLRANLGGGPRVTVQGGLAVYGRRGQGCRRCGTPVAMTHQGSQARSTYWCPSCQPPPVTRPSARPRPGEHPGGEA